jgi:hypothetical protein
MLSNGLDNLARPRPALSPSTSLRVNSADGSGVEGSRPNEPVCLPEAAAKDLPRPPFLIATRAYSRQELTHWKQRATTLPNRNKIHFVRKAETGLRNSSIRHHPAINKRLQTEHNVRLATCIVVRYYPVPRLEAT